MKNSTYLLVEAGSLPEVYGKVLQVKQILANGEASSTSEAVRMAGISRSVYYKYKDAVFPYSQKQTTRILTIQAILQDRPGVLMTVISVFHAVNANILTITQSLPIRNQASVTISLDASGLTGTLDDALAALGNTPGVENAKLIAVE